MAKRAAVWVRWHWRALAVVAAVALVTLAMGCAAYVYVDNQPVDKVTAVASDNSAPEIERVIAYSRTEVDIVFDEDLAESPVPADHFAVAGARISSAKLAKKDTVRLTLDAKQVAGRAYSLSIDEGAVTDAAGNLNLESNLRFAGFGASGGVLTVAHGGGEARPVNAVAGEREKAVVVDQLALTADGGDVRVARIKVRGLTTSESMFADLVEAWIFEDNGNGLFDANGLDRQLHVSVPFKGTESGSPAIFSDLNYTIMSGETKTLWVVFRLGNLAVEGRMVGSEVRPGDIVLSAGTLAKHPTLTSGNDGRTVYITQDANRFVKGRVIDPKTVIVTFTKNLPPRTFRPGSFLVNGERVEGAELGADDRTVRLLTRRPLRTKAVTVEYQPEGSAGIATWGVSSSLPGPTYRSPGDTLPPTAPGGVSASVGTTSPIIAQVSWTASSDLGGGVVAGYRVWRATSVGGYYRSIATTPASPFRDTSGVPDQVYYYKVSAYDTTGNESTMSAASGAITATWSQQPHATYGAGNLCALCHASHNAATANGILRTIPGGTTGTALCYQCHDGSGASTNVKTGATDSFALFSGHTLESLVDTTNVDLTNTCNDCHGPHQTPTGAPSLWRSPINGKVVTGNNNTWCHACHDLKHSWYKPGEAAYDSLLTSPSINATHYPTLGTYPGSDVATNPAKNAHADYTEAGQSEPFACLACHDNHRGTAPQDMLLYQLRPSTAASVAGDRQNGTYAQMCIRCHDGSVVGAGNIKQFVTANYADPTAYAGHRVLSPGATQPQGSPLPCYECHNVHGSGRGNNTNISDARGASLTTTEGATNEQVRQFCLTCHTTSDGFVWDGKTSVYRSVRTTETIVGLRRDGGVYGSGPAADEYNWLKLKVVDGHSNSAADKLKSCYRCHGDKYEAGKNNVHNPGPGESGGALSCAQCHDVAYNSMRTNTSYHHYMVGDAATAVTIADPSTITTTDARRTCLTCHVDHDSFNPSINPVNTTGRSANLRASISTAVNPANTATYLNTDFDPVSGTGVCATCHRVGMTKNTTNRRAVTDRSTATIKVTSPAFKASAHNYQSLTATYVSDGSAFKPNCSKCHDDRTSSEFLQTRQVASHDDTRPAILTDFGLNGMGEDPREAFCFACHSRSTDTTTVTPSNPFGGTTYTTTVGMKDVAGVRSMDATAVNIKGEFIAAGIVSSHPVTATVGARVECANCHSVHSAGEPNSVVTNPDNTLDNPADGSVIQFYTRWYSEANKSLAARTNRDFCLKCHDGAAPVATGNNATTYVPYAVTVAVDQSSIWNPTRRTNNKDDYQTKSHYNTTGQQATTAKAIDGTCADCHDRHGSKYPALIGVPNRTSAQDFLGARYVYSLSGVGAAVTGNDKSVCYACHTSATTGYAGNESRTASGYPMTGRFPGSAVATIAFNSTTHAGNPHNSAETLWPGREGDYAAGDCKNCHDPHGTANPYDELRSENSAGTEGQFTYTAGSQSFCFNCHDGVPGRDIKQFYPASAGGTGVDEFAGHKIRSASPSLPPNAALPCYDCHNSHGSASPYGLQVRNLGTTGLAFDLSTLGGVRDFCFACHVSSNGLGRINAGMVAISAGTQYVEGIDRTTGSLKLPPLAIPYIGHASGDAKSCYDCHGDRNYNAGGHNVHNPDITAITLDCYGCHAGAQYKDMDYSSTADQNTYHHVLGDTGVQADLNLGVSNSYPTSTSTLQCISCHTGHEYFDSARGLGGTLAGSNLRTAITDPAGTSRTNSDYSTSGSNGICISCHTARLAKDYTNQRSDGTTWAPAVTNAAFGGSAHQYQVTASVTSDSSALRPNCSKCHNSQITSTYTVPNAGFGVHTSGERNIISALGTTLTDPSGATHCLRCHSRTTDTVAGTKKTLAGYDWYGSAGATMTTTSEKVYGAFTRSGGSSHPVSATATGSLLCESCHNPHSVTKTAKVTKPSNNYTIAAYSAGAEKTAYCMECHGGSVPKYVSTTTTYVASDVTMTATWANKKTAEPRSHWVANGSIQGTTIANCADCHDKHGSRYEKLVGVYDPATDAATVKGAAITGNNETVCYACHSAVGLGYPTGVATTATVAEWDSWKIGGYVSPTPSATRTAVMWPGQATYALSPHGSNAWTAPSSLGGGPAKDCNACHDVHGTSQPYDELRLPYTAGNYSLCFACHEGSYSSTNIKQFYPTSMGGQNDGDNAGHRVKTAGGTYTPGTPLPCWECHQTHGSTDNNLDLLNDARWNNLSDLKVNDADCREFCLGCHTTEDRYRFSSFDATMIPVPASDTANLVAGLPRSPVDPLGNKLILPHLQTGLAHYKNGTEPCYECHGEDYTSFGSANVHNPSSGVSGGGSACYNCHTSYLEMEDDVNGGRGKVGGAAGNKTSYHHVLGSATEDGDWAPSTGTYSNSKIEVYCTSCHTDHNYFNATKNANLRTSVNANGASVASADFATTGDNGICVSCHTQSLSKDTVAQKNDGTTAVPKITGSTYTGSAHQYAVQSYYDSAATSFNANCSKCHDDAFDYEQDSTRRFGTHVSDERKLLGPLGDATAADPLAEKNCYRCHSVMADVVGGTKKSLDGKDWYGGQNMTAVSQTTFRAFQLAGSAHPVDPNANGSYLECGNCHNVHVSSATTPVVDPLNTYNGLAWTTANKSLFCLKCHDADRGPTGITAEASFVPTTVVTGAAAIPLMDKNTNGARGHWSVIGAIGSGQEQPCENCHDKHGSQYDKLIGVYTGASMAINAQPVTGNDASVCYACHTGASTNATTTPDRAVSGYIEQGTWLGKATWDRGYNAVEHTGSPHAQSTMLWPGTGGPGVGGDCKNCHDVHGTPNSNDMLRTTNSGGADTYRFNDQVFTVCFACHNGSQAGVSNIATFYPVVAGGTSGAARSGHRYETSAKAGQALPCYDCHNPHGTGDSAYSLMVTAKTGPSTTVVLGDQVNEIKLRPSLSGAAYDAALREFCFACHTTGDTVVGWNGSGYAPVVAGTTFEGIDRTSITNKLRLSNVSGHRAADTDACYFCHAMNASNNAHSLGSGMVDHTTTSGMTDDTDAAFTNANGNQCEDCHSPALGLYGQDLTAHKSAVNVVTCDNCHSDTQPNAAAVIAGDWIPRSCDTCHVTNNNGYSTGRHDSYSAASHLSDPFQTNNCANGTGCHGNVGNDLRTLHDGGASGNSSNPGCTAMGTGNMDVPLGNGCHAMDSRPNKKTCGGDGPGGLVDGDCHTTYQDGNHSSADPVKHTAIASGSISTSQLTSISAQGNGCGKCHQDGESTYTGANIAITDLDGVGVVSSLHDTDPLRPSTGCSVCHGNPRLNGGGVLGGTYVAECASCHTTFKTNYHRSYDESHTTDTSGYTCTMSTCHSTNIIEQHRSYEKPTQVAPTFTQVGTNATAITTLSTVYVNGKTLAFTNMVATEKQVTLRITWNLSTSNTAATASGYVVVKDALGNPIYTSTIQNNATTTYIQYVETIDISALLPNQNLTAEFWYKTSLATRTARNTVFLAEEAPLAITYTPTDDCDICHFNTGRLRPDGTSDVTSDPVLPNNGVSFATGISAQCESCHPYYEDYHYSHRATIASDGCIIGCHDHNPSPAGVLLDSVTLTGRYSLWAQHANLSAIGGRATTGWGNNTTGNGGTIEGGCGFGQTGQTCHNNPSLPDSSECADCHGPSGMNDTATHHDAHVIDGTGANPASPMDNTFGTTTTDSARDCINVCHAGALDWIHGVSISNPTGGGSYRSTTGVLGTLGCVTCHAAPVGSPVYNTNNAGKVAAGTLKCTDCHTGTAVFPGNGGRPHQGDPVDPTAVIRGANVFTDYNNTSSISGHRVPPFTNAYINTTGAFASTAGWNRTGGGGYTAWTYVSGAFLKASITDGTLQGGGTTLSTATVLYCADCHGKIVATGPQGAAQLKVGIYNSTTYTQSYRTANYTTVGTTICARCHDAALMTAADHTGNNKGAHEVQCTFCHLAVPHAWKRPKLIVKQTAYSRTPQIIGDPYPYQNNVNWQTADGNGLVGVPPAIGTYTTSSGSCTAITCASHNAGLAVYY